MEDFNLRSVAETSARDGDAARYRLDRFQRSKAAASVLRDAIKNACQREGLKLVSIGERYIPHTCPECGASMDFAAGDLTCRCNDCNEVFDQDYAAATNILKRGLAEGMSSHRGGKTEPSREFLIRRLFRNPHGMFAKLFPGCAQSEAYREKEACFCAFGGDTKVDSWVPSKSAYRGPGCKTRCE